MIPFDGGVFLCSTKFASGKRQEIKQKLVTWDVKLKSQLDHTLYVSSCHFHCLWRALLLAVFVYFTSQKYLMSRLWKIKCSDWNGSSGMCLLRPLKMQIRNFGLLVCRDVLWDGGGSELDVCREFWWSSEILEWSFTGDRWMLSFISLLTTVGWRPSENVTEMSSALAE